MHIKKDMVTDYKYKIFLTSEISTIDWSNCALKIEDVRYSLNKDKFIVRLIDPNLEENTLTHSEAIAIMSTSEWSAEE